MYTISDALVNFNSLVMFITIATSVFGALINRKTKKIETVKTKGFIAASIICVSIFYLAGIYMVGSSFLDMFNVTGDLSSEEKVSAIIKFSIFSLVLFISIVPSIIPDLIRKVKRQNVEI